MPRRRTDLGTVYSAAGHSPRPEDLSMIWLTVAIAVFLFVYLLVALLRPEWF